MKLEALSMADQLKSIRGVEGIQPSGGVDAPAAGGKTFGEFMMDQVKEVNDSGIEADNKLRQTVAGENPYPHSTMIAMQKADISFRLMMSVKERLVQAYEQLMRTPLG